jgi:peptidoglycan-associated lipoprotein
MASGPGGSATASARVTVSAQTAAAPSRRNPTLEELFTKDVQDAFFDYDKASLRDDARSALTKTADFLRSYPQVAIVIEGHCDERGSTEYNVALGDRRSDSAKDFLLQQGVAADRIQTVSYGKERPFCTQSSESCWQENRRAHFRMASTTSSQFSGN